MSDDVFYLGLPPDTWIFADGDLGSGYTRKHYCGNITADANVFQFSRARNMLRKQILRPGSNEMFLNQVKNIFASRTQILLPKLMFPKTY